MANDAFEIFKANAITRVTGNDPIKSFVNRINDQLAHAKDVKDGKTVKQVSTWFKRKGTGYEVSIGRTPLSIDGTEWFAASDIDYVIRVLNAAIDRINQDKELQKVITERSAAKSAKLVAARKAKKTK